VPNALIRDEELSASAKLLLIYLLSHKVGYQILDTQMIRESGLGRAALRTARKHLEDVGFIVLERVRNYDNSLGGYRYEIQDARGWFSTVAFSTVAQSTVAHSTVANPPHNRKLIPNKTNLKKTKIENTSDFDFNEFWDLFPRKQGRGKAKEAFMKAVKDVGLEAVMAGVRRYAADPNLPDPQFVPLPATWLNQERWDDGPLPLNRKLTNSERNIQNLRASMALLENEPMKEVESGQVTSNSIADFGINLRSANSI
jgi:hypothetical protein